jgi:hypothetical protein
MLTIFLIILAVIVFIGIIRVIVTPSESFFDLILDILLLDLLIDLLQVLFEGIGDSLD